MEGAASDMKELDVLLGADWAVDMSRSSSKVAAERLLKVDAGLNVVGGV